MGQGRAIHLAPLPRSPPGAAPQLIRPSSTRGARCLVHLLIKLSMNYRSAAASRVGTQQTGAHLDATPVPIPSSAERSLLRRISGRPDQPEGKPPSPPGTAERLSSDQRPGTVNQRRYGDQRLKAPRRPAFLACLPALRGVERPRSDAAERGGVPEFAGERAPRQTLRLAARKW